MLFRQLRKKNGRHGQTTVEFVAVLPVFILMLFFFVKAAMFFVECGYLVVGEFGTKRNEAALQNAAAYNCGDNGLFAEADGFCKNEK